MSGAEIEIVWLAAAIFFGLVQVGISVVASISPLTPDEAIDYLEWVLKPLTFLFDVSFLSLLFAVVMTWVYALTNGPSVVGIVMSSVVMLLAGVTFYAMRTLLTNVLLGRLRSVVRTTK